MDDNDRRHGQRFDLAVPFEIRNIDSPEGPSQRAESSDISSGGLYFSTDAPLRVGTRIEMLIRMPEEISGAMSPRLRCTGRVVRAHAAVPPQGRGGNGVEFHCYEILERSESGTEAGSRFSRFLLH